MTTGLRCYIVVNITEKTIELRARYEAGDLLGVQEFFVESLHLTDPGFRVVGLPSNWKLVLKEDEHGSSEQMPPLQELIVAIEFDDQAAREHFEAQARKFLDDISTGVDLQFQAADCWCPGEAADPIFGDREAAEALIHSDDLRSRRLTGRGVNVVIVDEGIDANQIPNNYGGGWAQGSKLPGTTAGGHGMMIVRNVLSVAPRATIFDCPILPPHITNIPQFSSAVDAAYRRMLTDIPVLRTFKFLGDNWLFVNAWAIYDRKSDPTGDYTNNPDHPFNRAVEKADTRGVDVVFCAGNCGVFCPKSNCGRNDRGPGRSIHGANSHKKVLTAGAVRTDAIWLGYSSQGPGQPKLAHEKPDLCAPSQFCENDDAHIHNTGTSASCALAAGVIAALRSRWGRKIVSPEELRDILRTSAHRKPGAPWNGQLGYGVLDAKAAYREAKDRHP